MADRYWVGGTANWDGTAGTKWSATSGGPGGASVPTTADAVFFNALSTGTCTISAGNTGAASINFTGFTGTIAGFAAITVAGSVTASAGMTWSYNNGLMTFTGTGTLTTAGKNFCSIAINGVGITLTLGDAFTNLSPGNIMVTSGTFNTAGFSVATSQLFSSGSTARTINLSSSTLTISGATPIDFSTSTNLTFNANTSQVNLTGQSLTFQGGGLTWNNVSLTNTNHTGTDSSINGTNTFANLTVVFVFNDPKELTNVST
jgi:hypothetical protein